MQWDQNRGANVRIYSCFATRCNSTENIMKTLTRAGGSGACNGCHSALLVFLNDSQRKMRQPGVFVIEGIILYIFFGTSGSSVVQR